MGQASKTAKLLTSESKLNDTVFLQQLEKNFRKFLQYSTIFTFASLIFGGLGIYSNFYQFYGYIGNILVIIGIIIWYFNCMGT